MTRGLLLLLISCVLRGTSGGEGGGASLLEMQSQGAGVTQDEQPGKVLTVTGGTVVRAEAKGQIPTSAPLEEEMDNQENIISQLLGDYDKVRTISSGSDCVCRCIVRPIRRSDCSRMQDSDSGAQVRDTYSVETVTEGKDCKRCECLAPPSAVNPCEGDYRFKKLQEASKDDIKLATIIDLLEGSLYGMDLLKLNSVTTKLLTRVNKLEKTFAGNLAEKLKEKERIKEKEKKSQQRKKKVNDLERVGQRSGSSSANKQKSSESEETHTKNNTKILKTFQDKLETKSTSTDKNIMVVKGVTFYKSEETEPTIEKEQTRNPKGRSIDLLISDELPPTRPGISTVTAKTHFQDVTIAATQTTTTTAKLVPTNDTQRTTASSSRVDAGPSIFAPQPGAKPRLSWTESSADQPKPTKKPGLCKDTVASISEPAQHNTYGSPDGAWMRDARGHGSVIYLTDGHYGNNLLEFRDMDTFKSGQSSNSYKLPYSFTGTGHVVFDGAFFYNRAFSRDIIRFDLRRRFVAAWTTLHDALLEEQAHRTHSEVELAVDESGLWVLYPALDSEGFHQEVLLLTQLRPRDLQPIQTFRTGLRRSRYGNSFLVCGVLYAVDNIQQQYANVTYAFDTHTLTHTVPLLAFTSTHLHTAQLSYCPLDKKLYSWDNGHQMMYDVNFAY